MVKLLFFGKLIDHVADMQMDMSLPQHVETTADLRLWLKTHHDQDEVFLDPSIRLAQNNAIIAEPAKISDKDEIAFLPPVGGG